MKFIDIINLTSWDEIEGYFIESHYFRGTNRKERIRKKIIKKYKGPYDELLNLKQVDTKMRLEIRKGDEGPFVDVSGLDGTLYKNTKHFDGVASKSMADVEVPFSLVKLEWEKWLGLQVTSDTLAEFSKIEIAAHCIWEMTFFGLTQEEVGSG